VSFKRSPGLLIFHWNTWIALFGSGKALQACGTCTRHWQCPNGAGLPVRNVQFNTTESRPDLPVAENLLKRGIVAAIALTAHVAMNAMLIQ